MNNTTLLPGTALIDSLAHIGDQLGVSMIEELTISAPIVIPDDGGTTVQIKVGNPEGERRPVTVYARAAGAEDWTESATGWLSADTADSTPSTELASWPPPGAKPVDLTDFYDLMTVDYGPAFHAVRAIWLDGDSVFAELRLDSELDIDGYGVHPVLLDALLHPLAVSGFFADPEQPRLAFAWSGVRMHATAARSLRVRLVRNGADSIAVHAVDETGAAVLDIDDLAVRPVDLDKLKAPSDLRDSLFAVEWDIVSTDSGPAPKWVYHQDRDTEDTPAIVVLRPDDGDLDATVPERVHSVGLHVLRALQDWLTDERWSSSRLVVVTRAGDLVHESVRGLVRGALSENPGRFGLVEVDRDDAGTLEAALALTADEPHVAVVGGGVRVARLGRVELAVPGGPSALAGGTVLVTGATGGLGRLVTEHLATVHGVAELVLVSRSGAPEEWTDSLTETGVQVRSVAADVADRDALADVVASVAERLTAVVHVAGIVDDAVVTALRPEQWDRVLRAKVDAAWHLHELTRELDLAAFVLYSSASSTFGGAGQGNYAAGNAFLDGLARYRHELGLPAISLAWGLWSEDAGMGGRLTDADLARMARAGTLPLSAEQGLTLFDSALGSDRPALVPIRLNLAAMRGRDDAPHLLRRVAPAGSRRAIANNGDGSGPSLADRLVAMPEADRNKTLLDLVRGSAAVVLGHADGAAVPEQRPFKDLGFDSLMAVELRNRLGQATGLKLSATVIFNYPTPKAMAEYLRDKLIGTREIAVRDSVSEHVDDDPVVIVGMGCRLPGGVCSPEDLWGLVVSG
ncbi:type I polyketide synthase, partial [Herbihabitans rhizosphaerae]|uniref:type I polyketide synthase n=1 Tax=Herbihabitans rhizosphaerae TaxID=1872711 RepID=UPI001F5F8480